MCYSDWCFSICICFVCKDTGFLLFHSRTYWGKITMRVVNVQGLRCVEWTQTLQTWTIPVDWRTLNNDTISRFNMSSILQLGVNAAERLQCSIFVFSLIFWGCDIKSEWYSLCVNYLENDVFCYWANILGPQMFSFPWSLRIVVLGRERSIGSSNGKTRLTLDIILFLFSESSIFICLK